MERLSLTSHKNFAACLNIQKHESHKEKPERQFTRTSKAKIFKTHKLMGKNKN